MTQRRKKKSERSTQRQAYGLTVLKAADPRIRQLKRRHEPSIHGNKFWASSWAIIDYLARQRLPANTAVMDIGCGWGLAGIYCAREFAARVTSVDADPAVFPFLDLHARINGVEIRQQCRTFQEMRQTDLFGQDVVLGADVCFWDELIAPLYELMERGLAVGVQQIILADPGRPPFMNLAERCVQDLGGEVKNWDVEAPVKARACLLIVGALPQ